MKRFGKKGAAVIIVLVLVVAGVFGWQRYEAAKAAEAANVLTLNGNVDVREVSLAFRGSDRIAEILVDEGDTVQAGQVLARLDSRELELSITKTQADIRGQESTVEKLRSGTRSEEIAQAQRNYESAQAAAANAQSTYARYQAIYDDIQGISRQTLDTARHDAEAKQAAAGAAASAYEEAVNGARPEDIAIGEASLDASNQELARLEYQLSQYELRAPADGVIRSRLLQPGDMASPSTPVFKLSLLDKKWVRAYVKETDLGKVYEGQAADVYIDSQSAPVHGQVGYISGTAEFTPKTVQTDELRTALVYEVRVYVDDPGNVLRLGMPATVKIAL